MYHEHGLGFLSSLSPYFLDPIADLPTAVAVKRQPDQLETVHKFLEF